MEDCLFCRIAAGLIPADLLYSDEKAVAFRDIDPQAPVHFLVVPRKHLVSVFELEEEDGGLLPHIFQVMKETAEKEGIADSGARILTNVGPEAGQVVMHMHFHVMGGRTLLWPPG